jgi:hypothetical protein
MEKLARLGYATKGLVYALVGLLAVRFVAGTGGDLTDSQGAVARFRHGPLGTPLVWAVAAGLGAYAAWRLVQAIWDPESGAHDARRIGQRLGYAASGVIHAALCVAMVQLALARPQHHSSTTYLGKLLALPGGWAPVAVAGIGVVAVGVYELYQAATARFMERLASGQMSARERSWARATGRLGLCAHGVVFGVIGWFLLRAAAYHRSSQARGVAGALREIAARSHSAVILGVLAVGLLGYAVYMFFTARYLRMGWDAGAKVR